MNGLQYEGYWKNGLIDIWGKLGNEKQMYEGELSNCKARGYGVMLSSDGIRYEGYFEEDMKDGKGTEILANGDIYEGTFKRSHKHGFGRYK
jgi:hypothetical protein